MRRLSGHVGVARRLSGHVGVARHLSGQSIKAGLPLSLADGQGTWTTTGHLIVPALSRRRDCRGEPLGVNYTNKQSHIVSVLSLVFNITIPYIRNVQPLSLAAA